MFKTVLTKFLDVIYPPRCISCSQNVYETGNICADCWNNINFISDPQCSICGFPFDYEVSGSILCGGCIQNKPNFAKARSVFIYDEASSRMITSFKYNDRLESRASYAKWMIRVGTSMLKETDYIIPVPLHYRKLLTRKYNQAAVLAIEIIKNTGGKIIVNGLIRKKYTITQAGFNRKSRFKNISGVFKVNEKYISKIRGKNILLIDDVITTGATANECAKILLKAGAAKVEVLTLAKTLY